MTMRTEVYPEITTPNDGKSKPIFPDECPKCLAVTVALALGHVNDCMCKYACGGTYTCKPQIQNHTNKWWGYCGMN